MKGMQNTKPWAAIAGFWAKGDPGLVNAIRLQHANIATEAASHAQEEKNGEHSSEDGDDDGQRQNFPVGHAEAGHHLAHDVAIVAALPGPHLRDQAS